MERLTHERVNGIKTGYWSAATKEVLVQKLAACEAYGQPSYIMELTPAFTDVIVKRYIRITGKTTVRCVRQGRELPREEIAAIFEPDEEGGEQE